VDLAEASSGRILRKQEPPRRKGTCPSNSRSNSIEPSRLLAVVRYVLQNPVRAGLVDQAWKYRWSSARWLVGATHTDPLVRELGPMAKVSDWRTLLKRSDGDHSAIRQHTRTGRPFEDESFVAHVERLVGRRLHKQKPGPMPKR